MIDDGLRPDLANAILARVGRLRLGTTCCPSEIARDLCPDWRPMMESVRDQAMRLQDQGLLCITQRGAPVHGPTIRGPIRLGPGPTQKDSDV